MSDLPGYDDWKTRDPDEDCCEFCGANLRHLDGWEPGRCIRECGRNWRDPDAEYEKKRERDEAKDL